MVSYDCIIIGAGPAGLGSAIYQARYKVNCMVIGSDVGGTANLAHDIENWPGMKGPGWEIMAKFKEHVESFDVPIVIDSVAKIEKAKEGFIVRTEKQEYEGKTILLAMGTKRKKLGVPGEEEYMGKGISHCATCDCVFMKGKKVGVVGGSDAAAMAAQILAEHADEVVIIYRKEHMRAEPARVDDLEKNPKIKFEYNANVTAITGEGKVEKVKLDTGKELDLEGLFIEIGGEPLTEIAKDLGIKLSPKGRIEVDAGMRTSVKGIYAAGDITTGSNEFNQIATAVSEGSIAALSIFNDLK